MISDLSPQANNKAVRKINHLRAIRFSQSLDKALRFILCATLLFQTLLVSTVRPVAAGVKEAATPAAAQNSGPSLQGTPATVAASAVINFSQLAAQEAAKPAPSGPAVPKLIHSPVTVPEADAPSQATPDALPAAPSPSVPSPSPSSSFIGMTDIPTVGSGFVVIPPDTTGAVGLTKIFTTVNNNYVVQDKTTGALSAPVSMDTFWTGIGATGTFDPRTIYDPYNDRWIVSAVSDSNSANSSILVGVSQTGDPGGTYFLFRVDYDSTNTNWADFPCVGFNKNWVAINCNSVAQPGPAIPNKALVINYPSLRTNVFSATFFSGTGTCAFPVSTYSSTENTLYVTTHLSSAGGTYRLDTITGTAAAPAYALGATKSRTGGGWTQPLNQILPQSGPVAGTISACGAGVPCPLETQDSQVRSEPVLRNGNIYYAQTVGLPAGGLTRTAAQWTKIDTSGNFVDGGRVDDPTATSSNGGKWYAYASLSVNQNNDVLFGFSQFASNQHPAAGYTFRFGTDAAGTMQDPLIYKAGEDYYHKTFSLTRNRFGDYSRTQVDPSNDFDLWTLQEYTMLRAGTDDGNTGSNSSKWSTWWAKIALAPTLAKVRSFNATGYDDGRVLLQWKSSYEVDNLGYNVYSEIGGLRTKLTPQPIAGSALVTRPGIALTAGNSYAWADQPQNGAVKYWLEDVDLNGKSNWTGPVSINPSTAKGKQALDQSLLLNKIGLAQGQMSYGFGSGPVESKAEVASSNAAALQNQTGIASGPAVKLSVKQEGWYYVAQRDLISAGLDSRVDPRKLQLFVDGQQVPIRVTGEPDGRFDAADGIEFYGIGLDSTITDTHVYWLVGGAQAGMRIKPMQTGQGTAPPASFAYSVERKDRTVYFSALRNGDAENFFGPVIAGSAVDQSLTLQNVAAAAPQTASLNVALQGVTIGPHAVSVMLNGTTVGVVNFSGQARAVANFAISQTLLREGSNIIQLIGQGGTDISLADSVRVTYWHKYVADHNVLKVSATAGQRLTISGFTASDVRVMDVSNPNSVVELTGTISGTKTNINVSVTPPGTGTRLLYVFTGDRAKAPAAKANGVSNLHDTGQQATYIMITRAEMMASLQPLKALRESQGQRVVMVDVEDIYDEFSYGNKNVQAIKDFLLYAKQQWRQSPRYLLMAGDACYDGKNYLGFGDQDLVPSKLIDTFFMEAPSDDWFTDFDGDGVPDMAAGRLPVSNAQEATALVTKMIGYESSIRSNSTVLVSDASDGYDFAATNAALKKLLPGEMTVEEIRRGTADDATVKNQLLNAIKRGQTIVNYNGHGSVNLWRGNLLANEDAAGLTNRQQLSLFVIMTCLNGYFNDPALVSLAESLLRANGGAAAVWASTAQCEPSGQASMNLELYKQLFKGDAQTLGDATTRAKAGVTDPDVRRTWILFGDPASRLR